MSTHWTNRLSDCQVLVLLQNAYTKGSLKQGWNYQRWFNEFSTSRSGQRISTVFEGQLKAPKYTNCTTKMGDNPDSLLVPMPSHVKSAISRVKPKILLACGAIAEDVAQQVWQGDLIVMPHPAFRVLTNSLLVAVREAICNRLDQYDNNSVDAPIRFKFAQERGKHKLFVL